MPIGLAPQAVAYVPNAVPDGDGMQGLQPLGLAGQSIQLTLEPAKGFRAANGATVAPTSVSLFDQGLLQVLQASVTGLESKQPYVLGLAGQEDGGGTLEPLAAFMTNPAGSAIVDTIGPIRQVVRNDAPQERRFLVIATGTANRLGAPVQVQAR